MSKFIFLDFIPNTFSARSNKCLCKMSRQRIRWKVWNIVVHNYSGPECLEKKSYFVEEIVWEYFRFGIELRIQKYCFLCISLIGPPIDQIKLVNCEHQLNASLVYTFLHSTWDRHHIFSEYYTQNCLKYHAFGCIFQEIIGKMGKNTFLSNRLCLTLYGCFIFLGPEPKLLMNWLLVKIFSVLQLLLN